LAKVHNPSPQEAAEEESQVQGQPGLLSKNLPKSRKKGERKIGRKKERKKFKLIMDTMLKDKVRRNSSDKNCNI
jgi:hypothetical protein